MSERPKNIIIVSVIHVIFMQCTGLDEHTHTRSIQPSMDGQCRVAKTSMTIWLSCSYQLLQVPSNTVEPTTNIITQYGLCGLVMVVKVKLCIA